MRESDGNRRYWIVKSNKSWNMVGSEGYCQLIHKTEGRKDRICGLLTTNS